MIYYRKTLFSCGPKLTAVQIEQHYSHLDAVKAVNQLRGEQSRQLIEASGAIDKRFEWNDSNSRKLNIKSKSK